jgi:hypothetical protein
MSARLIPALIALSLLMAAFAAAGEPCVPGTANTSARSAGAAPCDDRGLPGAAALRPQGVPPSPPALGAPLPSAPLGDDGPSLLGALARLVGAVIVLAALMAACVLGYRALVRRAGARSGVLAWATGWADDTGADAVRVASRRYLGGRESVAVIHAGSERFLVGITATQVSLLARLETPVTEPAGEFTDALARAATPRPPADDSGAAADHFRAAVERSRERLGRLGHLTVIPRDGRA